MIQFVCGAGVVKSCVGYRVRAVVISSDGTPPSGTSIRPAAAARKASLVVDGLPFGFATFVRVGDYSSESRLWSATVRASPENARAWNNLGYALAAEGDVTGARAAYEKALAIEPSSPRARGNLDALPR